MADQFIRTKENRFIGSNVKGLQQGNHDLMRGYPDVPLVSLEEAVKSIVPIFQDVMTYVHQAKERCRKNTRLTINESAAIYLYTMTNHFYENLNKPLRFENPQALQPWSAFLKLFFTAVGKLPSCPIRVWRGIYGIVGSNFDVGDDFTWWCINSCSSKVSVAGMFAGEEGTLFSIDTIHGKNITEYSANQNEEEILLMPGTRLRIKDKYTSDGFSIVHLQEWQKEKMLQIRGDGNENRLNGMISGGQHVMLSYHGNNQDLVSKIYDILRAEHIPVWFEKRKDKMHDLHRSLSEGVQNASVICCFMSPDYQQCNKCKLELQYARKQYKEIIPYLLYDSKIWNPSDWLKTLTKDLKCIVVQDSPDLDIDPNITQLIYQIKYQASVLQSSGSKPSMKASYLFELIRYEYQQNNRVERLVNPAISFPIEQSYINLALVTTKEQQETEKQLRNAQHGDNIMGTFEEIYGMKTTVDIKNIFKTCKHQNKQVLVFGRAGIGKSTFCRYAAYQWATGAYWSEYELLALIPLRRLTTNRYPSDRSYTLIDLVKKEVFSFDLSGKDEERFKEEFDENKTLWILDGYDEIVQNIPSHLELLLERLLKTPHHIITSRPYLNTLSYDVQMEITGFTDENIEKYVQQFFDQMPNTLDNTSITSQALLKYLKLNQSIWGVAHIPVYLELICSLWSNEDWSETQDLTITTLYRMMTEWLVRRYLKAQNISIEKMTKKGLYRRCQKEFEFLESLAFNAMENNTIIVHPSLLEKTLDEVNVSLEDHPQLLNLGILKSYNEKGIGTQIETDKDHYFIHLSFQEYFAARYLINALHGDSQKRAIAFITYQKYNQRHALVFTFMSALIGDDNHKPYLTIFWNAILSESLDLVGLRHMTLVISCLEANSDRSKVPQYHELLKCIAKCLENSFTINQETISKHLLQLLQRATSIQSDSEIINAFINALQSDCIKTKLNVLQFISRLEPSNSLIHLITPVMKAAENLDPDVRIHACRVLAKISDKTTTSEVISKLMEALGDKNARVRNTACETLTRIDEKAATSEIISKLVSALDDADQEVRSCVCTVLGQMGTKAATSDVISKLMSTSGDANANVSSRACKALGQMGEKAATTVVISKLVSALGDADQKVRICAWKVLEQMGDKVATTEVISKLISALDDADQEVRSRAYTVLGQMGEKAATTEVISKLVSALGDPDQKVRICAWKVLEQMGEKAATTEVISKLVSALGDADQEVRSRACTALRRMGEKAATSEVISKLVNVLGDPNKWVRMRAWKVLKQMAEKAATSEVISKLVSALGDADQEMRSRACVVLGQMGEKAATSEVISKLVSALDDADEVVRSCASIALGQMGEKAATCEVISKLVNVLGDRDRLVRMRAWKVLEQMGDKAATAEVISRLVSALGDSNEEVRSRACTALWHIGEKAFTSEVISKLARLLENPDRSVRIRAWEALGQMGEKAVTNEMISKLVIALDDEHTYLRSRPGTVFGQIDEKIATSEVISKLVSALGDADEVIRSCACIALRQMGEKAATCEVISKLVNVLGDPDRWVRICAWKVLEQMGDKAATAEVISKLGSALGDSNEEVRSCACTALRQMGEKAFTCEVISSVVSALEDVDWDWRSRVSKVFRQVGDKAATSEVIRKVATGIRCSGSTVRSRVCIALGNVGETAATTEMISKLVVLLNSADLNLRLQLPGTVTKILSSSEAILKLDPQVVLDLCQTQY